MPKRSCSELIPNSVPARKSKISSDSSETLKRLEGEYETGCGRSRGSKNPLGILSIAWERVYILMMEFGPAFPN